MVLKYSQNKSKLRDRKLIQKNTKKVYRLPVWQNPPSPPQKKVTVMTVETVVTVVTVVIVVKVLRWKKCVMKKNSWWSKCCDKKIDWGKKISNEKKNLKWKFVVIKIFCDEEKNLKKKMLSWIFCVEIFFVMKVLLWQ